MQVVCHAHPVLRDAIVVADGLCEGRAVLLQVVIVLLVMPLVMDDLQAASGLPAMSQVYAW